MTHLLEAMFDRGFSIDRLQRTKWMATDYLGADMIGVIGKPALDRWARDADRIIHQHGGPITYQVRVLTPSTEHLVDVLATTSVDAQQVACQMVGCRGVYPTHAEVVTDSTLTNF